MSKLPAAGEGKRGEEGYLGYLLRQAASAHRSASEHALKNLNLTQPQFLILTMLAAYPGSSNADLARLALLTPQTMNAIVGNLEKTGAVERRAHAVHGRIQQLELTEHGHVLLAKAKKCMAGVEQALLEELSPEEERTIRRWLVKVAVRARG